MPIRCRIPRPIAAPAPSTSSRGCGSVVAAGVPQGVEQHRLQRGRSSGRPWPSRATRSWWGHRSSKARPRGVNGDPAGHVRIGAGAVYVFTRAAGVWSQQAYVKASNTSTGSVARFGSSVAVSGDTLAVGRRERSEQRHRGQRQPEHPDSRSGRARRYVFTRAGKAWTQQAYLKASNTRAQARVRCRHRPGRRYARRRRPQRDERGDGRERRRREHRGLVRGRSRTSSHGRGPRGRSRRISRRRTPTRRPTSAALSRSPATLVVGADGESSASAATPTDTSAGSRRRCVRLREERNDLGAAGRT